KIKNVTEFNNLGCGNGILALDVGNLLLYNEHKNIISIDNYERFGRLIGIIKNNILLRYGEYFVAYNLINKEPYTRKYQTISNCYKNLYGDSNFYQIKLLPTATQIDICDKKFNVIKKATIGARLSNFKMTVYNNLLIF